MGNLLLIQKLGELQSDLKGSPPYEVRTISLSNGEITTLLRALIAIDAMRAAIVNN